MIRRFFKRLGLILLVIVAGKLGGEEILSRHLEKNPAEAKMRARVVVGGCALLAGLALMLGTVAWNFEHVRTSFWPTTTGTIKKSEGRWMRSTRIRLDLICTYTVDGVDYATNRIKLEPDSYRDMRFAIEDTDRYPVGTTVRVWYDPKRPHFGILEPGYDLGSNRFFQVGIVLSVIGVVCFCFQLMRSVARNDTADPFKSPDHIP